MNKPFYHSKLVPAKDGRMVRGELEKKIYNDLLDREVVFTYEPYPIAYVEESKYTPDIILPNGIIVEIKGYLIKEDRKKMVAIKEQHPELDIRFVFGSFKKEVEGATKRKDGSKLTNLEWALKNGFKCAEKTIPEEWVQEDFRKYAND